jgi:hypothetical protein
LDGEHCGSLFTGAAHCAGGRGARSDLPAFVVGMPRSGTTLVEQILASHPMVHGAGELKRLQTLIDGIKDFPAPV